MPIYAPGHWLNPETRPEGCSIAGAGRIAVRAGDRFDRHHHEGDEVWFIARGRAWILVEGAEREVGPGDIVLVPAGTSHDILAVDGTFSGFFLEQEVPGQATGHLHRDVVDAAGHEVVALAEVAGDGQTGGFDTRRAWPGATQPPGTGTED
ncbi:cupin domain-containing protein [Agromyces albus]|uniref:cupin domain-containing protein n=1 Tax=Agromyces albus TaxID=205332 RepID=UPI00278B75E5|nr:cupin domain-containing protein [Agromyces albus]MDQ0577687.1 mannose-6-phosphate isomerase-like protein (cupin superfamily) [Agromyces albus]